MYYTSFSIAFLNTLSLDIKKKKNIIDIVNFSLNEIHSQNDNQNIFFILSFINILIYCSFYSLILFLIFISINFFIR